MLFQPLKPLFSGSPGAMPETPAERFRVNTPTAGRNGSAEVGARLLQKQFNRH